MKFKPGIEVLWNPNIKNVKPILCRVTGAYMRFSKEVYTVQPIGGHRTWLVKDVEQLKLAPKPKRPAKLKEGMTLESAQAQIEAAVRDGGGEAISPNKDIAEGPVVYSGGRRSTRSSITVAAALAAMALTDPRRK